MMRICRNITKAPFLSLCLFALLCLAALPGHAEPIKIGAIYALTGKAANSNKAAVLGTQLAVRELNRQGGLLGENIELLLIDNESSPIGSHLAAEKAAEAGVAAIIGASWSSHSLAVAKVAELHRIPMISPISTIPSLTAIGNYIFRVCYNDDFQGSTLAKFAFTDIGARRAVIFVDISSDFSMYISKVFSQTFVSLGGTIVKEIEYKTGQGEFRSEIKEALAYDADVVFLSGYDESGYIAAGLQAAGSRAVPIGSDGWEAKSFFSAGGDTIKRGYFINHWLPTDTSPRSLAFVEKFIGEGEILAATALAYDAVHVLAAAIEKAGSSDRDKIHDSLRLLQNFEGITGNISFNAQGDAAKQACIAELREGVPYFLKCFEPER
jgi:branched-chain amino acid transport system substrate-binding protein